MNLIPFQQLHVLFSTAPDGSVTIRKWSQFPFDGGHAYALTPTVEKVETPAQGTPSTESHMSREAAMRKAGQLVIDDLIDQGGWCIASDDDLADYMTRIVDACVRAATTEGQDND